MKDKPARTQKALTAATDLDNWDTLNPFIFYITLNSKDQLTLNTSNGGKSNGLKRCQPPFTKRKQEFTYTQVKYRSPPLLLLFLESQ